MERKKKNPVPVGAGHGIKTLEIQDIFNTTGMLAWLQRVSSDECLSMEPIGDVARPLVARIAAATAANSPDPAARRSARRYLARVS